MALPRLRRRFGLPLSEVEGASGSRRRDTGQLNCVVHQRAPPPVSCPRLEHEVRTPPRNTNLRPSPRRQQFWALGIGFASWKADPHLLEARALIP
jgi:hypothetical protein